MIAVISLLIVVVFSFLVVRVGAVALVMTGVSEDVAQFQALSAFSGAGFTTSESESIVSHPARRRVITLLIRLGSAGLVTAISTLMLSFVGAGQAAPERLLVLFLGLLAILWLAKSRTLNRALTPLIRRALARYTTLDLRDYAELLNLQKDYSIVEIDIVPDSWLADNQLGQLELPAEGVRVLGVMRFEGDYIGAPPPDLYLRPGDRLIVYGREHRLQEIATRHANDQAAHRAAKAEYTRDLAKQEEMLKEANRN